MKNSINKEESSIILGVGDVHGHWDYLAQYMKQIKSYYGRLDGVICAGDAEALRNETDLRGVNGPVKYRTLGTFPQVMDGTISLVAPVWFIGGNHEPYPELDKHGPGKWGPNVVYLGRSGIAEILGMRVAYLSGIYSPKVSEGKAMDRHSPKERSYWVKDELENLIKQGKKHHIDLLVTHDWPTHLGVDRNQNPTGNADMERLCLKLRPTMYICGHMHHRESSFLHNTRIEALAHICSMEKACFVFSYTGKELCPLPVPPLQLKFPDKNTLEIEN